MKLSLMIGIGIIGIILVLVLINIVNINIKDKIYAIILKDDMQFLYNYNDHELSELHIKVISNHTSLDTLLDNEPKKVIASLKGDPIKEYWLVLDNQTIKLNNHDGIFIAEYYEGGYNIIPNKLIVKSTEKRELEIVPLVKENIFDKIILYEVRRIKIDGKELIVEVADNNEKRELGLMFREYLPEKAGMLFILDKEEEVPFWMKNMRMSLDIIWIDSRLRVIDITKYAEPCVNDVNHCMIYKPKGAVKYVLEVKAGFVDKYNIKVGDSIEL